MRTWRLALWLVVALLAWGTPALAHVALEYAPAAAPVPSELPDAQTLIAAAPVTAGLWTVLAAVAVLALAIARRRRAVALVCVAVLMLIAFEAGRHSVHHIGDHGDSSCVIASASAHTGALTVDAVAFEHPVEVATPVAFSVGTPATVRSSAPDLGRAPPA
jgi:hypothetical protein